MKRDRQPLCLLVIATLWLTGCGDTPRLPEMPAAPASPAAQPAKTETVDSLRVTRDELAGELEKANSKLKAAEGEARERPIRQAAVWGSWLGALLILAGAALAAILRSLQWLGLSLAGVAILVAARMLSWLVVYLLPIGIGVLVMGVVVLAILNRRHLLAAIYGMRYGEDMERAESDEDAQRVKDKAIAEQTAAGVRGLIQHIRGKAA